ncbi:MAG: hypothetical protein U0K54_02765 [Acutalibacteraceae bacterium]|nr:hypothetical protein [Acutalibacteraceae bacterium]
MDAIFSIPYGEYAVADKLTNLIKSKNISIFIPASRQEKGIDLLVYSFDGKNNQIASVQVKQSRTYYKNKLLPVNGKKIPVTGYLWFNRFDVPDNADWIILTGTRVVHPTNWEKASINDVSWDPIMLAFTHDEMTVFMSNVKQKKDPTKDDKMFGFWYDEEGNIYQERGCPVNREMNAYLIEKRISEIAASIK